MPTAGFNPPQGNQSVAQLQDWIVKLCRDLDYYMNNLDDVNVNRLTAQKIFVTELSAISANLGKVVAGILVGAYIATADGTYPRVEMSSSGNLFSALFDATHSLSMIPSLSGTPGLSFVSPTSFGNIIKDAFFTFIANVDILLQTSSNVRLAAGQGGTGKVIIDSIGGIVINNISSLSGTKVYYVSDTSGGATTRKLTFTDGILTKET